MVLRSVSRRQLTLLAVVSLCGNQPVGIPMLDARRGKSVESSKL